MSSSARFPPLFGSHEVVRVVAKGGMGAVFEVKSRAGARYAAKTILNAKDVKARERFRREAELLARCDRIPGIVKVHTFGEQPDGTLFMILDFVDGPSLDWVLHRRQKIPAQEASLLVRDVARALGAIHALGIVHRDVKPGNVLVDSAGVPWLTDFGLAVARDMERLTRTGAFVGTVSYCSPEQASGSPCGPASDVFSLGCVLFHMLSGEVPIQAESSVGHMAQLSSPDPMRDVRSVEPAVPPALASIVARAVEKDPDDRYVNGEALAQDLTRFLSGESVEGLPWRAPRRLLMGLTALMLFLAGALVVAIRVRAVRAENAASDARVEAEKARAIVAKGDVGEARECIERARELLDLAQRSGAAALGSALETVDAASAEVASIEAQRALARGSLLGALSILEGEKSLPPEARLVRGRALLLLGRPREAAEDLEAAAAGLHVAKRADALELLGDALLELDPARAETAFAAVEEAGHRTNDIRAKRASAAAAAGHDDAAIAAVKAIFPDLLKVPQERAANAALEGAANAFYRKGLAAKDGRLLDVAWKLGPPPAALVTELRARWLAQAGEEGNAWALGYLGGLKVAEEDLETIRLIFSRAGRLRAPGFDLYQVEDFAGALRLLRIWSRNAEADVAERAAVRFLADWPDQPLFFFMRAFPYRRAPGDRPLLGLHMIYDGIDRLPPVRADEMEELHVLATLLAIVACELERPPEPLDLERVKKAIFRGNHADGWLCLARIELTAGHGDKARAALSMIGPDLKTQSDTYLRFVDLESEWIRLLELEGNNAEAIERARGLAMTSDGIVPGSRALGRLGRPDLVTETVDPVKVDEGDVLIYWMRGAVAKGRIEDAKKVLLRVERRAPQYAEEAKKIVKEAESAAHR